MNKENNLTSINDFFVGLDGSSAECTSPNDPNDNGGGASTFSTAGTDAAGTAVGETTAGITSTTTGTEALMFGAAWLDAAAAGRGAVVTTSTAGLLTVCAGAAAGAGTALTGGGDGVLDCC